MIQPCLIVTLVRGSDLVYHDKSPPCSTVRRNNILRYPDYDEHTDETSLMSHVKLMVDVEARVNACERK